MFPTAPRFAGDVPMSPAVRRAPMQMPAASVPRLPSQGAGKGGAAPATMRRGAAVSRVLSFRDRDPLAPTAGSANNAENQPQAIGSIFHPIPTSAAPPAGTVRLDALEVEEWERKIKGMLFQRGESEKEIAALRKENDSYAERFRSLEDALRVALKDAALWQGKVTQAEDKSAQALRDKVAAGAAAAAAKNDLKQANARLERVELELQRIKAGSGVNKEGTMARPHPALTRELDTMRREIQQRDVELEALANVRRELAVRTRELADERGRSHLLQAEVRELKSLTHGQSHRLATERSETLRTQLDHQTKLVAALQHELEDAKKVRTSEATAAQVEELRAQLQRKTDELQRKTDELAAAASKSATGPASASAASAASAKKPGAMPVRPGVHDTPIRAPNNQALVAAQAQVKALEERNQQLQKQLADSDGGAALQRSLATRDEELKTTLDECEAIVAQATRRAQEAEAKAAVCEARTRELEAELQTVAAAAAPRGPPVHAEVVRESMVSSINMPVTDFGDLSLLSDVSEDDDAMRAFNAGVGRRYTAGALARATSIGPVAQPPLYEAILDYTSTTNAGNDLHFRKGERIRVTEKGQEGWWWGCIVRPDGTESAVGRFPLPYVRLPGSAEAGEDDDDEDDD